MCIRDRAGIVAGDPDKELEVIASVEKEAIAEMKEFLEKTPISVEHVDNGFTFEIVVTLYKGEAWSRVRIVNFHTNIVLIETVSYTHLLEEPEDIVFVASSAHPLAGRKGLELKELLPEPFLLTEKDASYRFVLDRYLTSMDLRIEPFLEIGNTEFIIRLLKNNAGISFLPEFSIKNEISAGHLAVLPVKDFHMHIWRQILYHKDKWVTREMDAFIRLAQEAP